MLMGAQAKHLAEKRIAAKRTVGTRHPAEKPDATGRGVMKRPAVTRPAAEHAVMTVPAVKQAAVERPAVTCPPIITVPGLHCRPVRLAGPTTGPVG
ncbi:hypothetical protein BKD30_15160 [Tersicoccus phoenicis]|uniref:Uncharacterized protein n=1 Tax=Tersicoccus phoenicis TaxID=554083 RepID=A0A1R1L5Y8_9MICC|nr:hypothetical protein BKD30_15160 [Tersicoccus phoenicis]